MNERCRAVRVVIEGQIGGAMTSPGIDEYVTYIELADTDAFGVIFWGSPVRWTQRGYENLARQAGHPIQNMLNLDHDHPVVNASIELYRPLRLGDRIRVRTHISKVGSRSFHVLSRVFGEDDSLAVKTTVIHVATSRTNNPVRLDDWVRSFAESAAVAE
jgi:acyl-CoA thioester hydrolase